MSKKKKRARSQRKNEITKGIFTVLESDPNKSFNYKQIASKLGITDTKDRNDLIQRLGQLKAKERILEEERGRFKKKPSDRAVVVGKVDLASNGNAYIMVEDADDDIFVPSTFLNKAFHGDTVQVQLRRKRNGRRPEGTVVKVLERKKSSYVGIVEKHERFVFVRPTDPKMYTDILFR